jgi:16S rRNA (cytidine1402-2'-O)-methyltransferase
VLYVCPTPIGNLDDITPRVLDALGRADLVACEDTRRTGRLLERFGLRKELVSFYEHNEDRRVASLLARLREGATVALVSDAGMPGLSDPGFTLVRAALEEGLPVTVLPGASAVTVALVASGLPTDRFTFAGFVPRGAASRVLGFIEEAGAAGGTVVVFESPKRLPATLRALAERWPERRLAVCRELTKLHEQVIRGRPEEVLAKLSDPVKGEIVLVLEPLPGSKTPGRAAGASGGPDEEELASALDSLLERGWGAREAATLVSQLSSASFRPLYSLALERSRRRS